ASAALHFYPRGLKVYAGFSSMRAVDHEIGFRALVVQQEFTHLPLNLCRRRRGLFQPGDSILFTLTNLVTVVAVPCARFFNLLLFLAQFNQLAEDVDTFAVEDLALSPFERCCEFVLLIPLAGFATD